jgi:hypothetical protein
VLTDYSYDFEYEDDDEEQSGDVDIENKYYNAKQLKADDPEAAIDEFLGTPALEKEKGDWYRMRLFIVFATIDDLLGDSKVSSRQSNWSSSLGATSRFACSHV